MILAIAPVLAVSNTVYPKPATVSDYTGTLTGEEQAALTTKINTFRQETSSEIALLLVNTTDPETIEQYSIHVAEQWKIGKKDIDNGLLFTIAIQDRAMRIEVGKGLEGVLPDLLTTKILSTYTSPEFKAGNYYKGINDTLDVVMSAAKKEFNTEELLNSSDASSGISENNLSFIIWLVFIFAFSFVQYLSKSKSWWQGGVFGGGAALILSLIFSFGFTLLIGVTISFALLGFLIDYAVSKNPDIFGGGKGGGGFFFGGGSGGSGGGFSGFGGGGFSGGGGSGRW